MIEILKYPKFNNKMKCVHCGCEFMFESSDITTSLINNPAYRNIQFNYCTPFHVSTVRCPGCNGDLIIKFNKESVGKDGLEAKHTIIDEVKESENK